MKTNIVLHDDCLNVMKKIETNSVKLIVTDPPYEIEDMSIYFNEMLRVLQKTGSIYVFGDKNMIANKWFNQFPMRNKELLIWHYVNSPKPKGRWRGSFQSIIYGYHKDSPFYEDRVREEYLPATKRLNGRERPSLGRMKKQTNYDTSKGALPRDVIKVPALLGHLSRERVGHKDQKPRAIIDKLILASSDEGDLVLDCFGGSGTTAESCVALSREYVICEKDIENYKMITKRLKK